MMEMAAGPVSAHESVMNRAVEAMREAPGVLLLGPPRIGRSRLLEQLVAHGRAIGVRVLRCSPVAAEQALPFMGLIDLLEDVDDEALDRLPAGQGDALRAALLRGGQPDAGQLGDARVPLAVLTLLRQLADQGPVWLVVDDLHWVDEPTARVLGFVARRIGGTLLRMVAGEPVAAGRGPAFASLCPPGTARLTVPPLTPAELAVLLAEHAGQPLPSATVREIARVARGNPGDALELLRTLPPDGLPFNAPAANGGSSDGLSGWVHGGPNRAPTAAEPPGGHHAELLRTLPEPAREALLLVSAAARPDLTLLATAGGPSVTVELETAERLGMLRIAPDGQVVFDSPALGRAVYAEAGGRSRRNAHARLAAAETEPVERARHRALANPARDEEVARSLMTAAATARRRSAPGTAAELAALAVARTPVEQPELRTERRLTAADYAVDAGHRDAARAEAQALLEEPDPEVRVRARLVLLRCAGQSLEHEGGLIRDGLAEAAAADSPGLEARLRCWQADRDLLAGRLDQAEAAAGRAADLAAAANQPETQLEALTTLAYLRRLGGDPRAESTLALALETARANGIDDVRLREALMTEAVFHLHANRLAAAESSLLELLRRFTGQLGMEELIDVTIQLAGVRIRAADCAGALRAARQVAALHARRLGVEQTGEDGYGAAFEEAGPVAYVTAAAESVGGSLELARQLAQRGARTAELEGDRFWLLWNLTVLGRVHLMGEEPEAAVRALRKALDIERAMGIVDPGVGRWHADLVEALVCQGGRAALDEARALLDQVTEAARRLDREAVLGCLERAEALWHLAHGEHAEAAALLERAVARLRSEGVPLELARALAAQAQLERRRRRQGAARSAADEALRICQDTGAAAWLGPIKRRIQGGGGGRAGAARQPADASGAVLLTPSEQRIAALAADGATNREIAAACYISVKTVEASLSRVYRKLGVRSRTELAKAPTD
ncbi:AAA family ATPase [Kitasatospora acidiphila]|uniref:AAA family ATPase n=2 Tax=Kitasatospora acidiphila TaxID=2567942 RepID=A0A540VYN8_9ACTN|nr:AAA family ATPase [Kitasatospora acidiphila]